MQNTIFEFQDPLGLYNIKRTEMGGHFECRAAKTQHGANIVPGPVSLMGFRQETRL